MSDEFKRVKSGIMRKGLLFLVSYLVLHTSAFPQQPQAPAGTPLYSVNAKYVNGMAPGYWATAGSGLTLSLSAGTAYCGNPPAPVSYPGGSLSLAASATNYIYLDPANNCAPTARTSSFTAGQIPIAKVVTGASSITSITDARTWFAPQPCVAGSAGEIHCSSMGTNQNITLTPSGTGASVVTNLEDKGGQVFNVKAYGAAGDGTTDDTSAINSAETARAAAFGRLYFPCGTYMISSTLSISAQGTWQGEAASADSSGSCVTIKAKSGTSLNPMINIGHKNITLSHIRVDANADAIEGIRVRTSGGSAQRVIMRDVQIQDFPLADSSVIALDAGDTTGANNNNACSDCAFYDVFISPSADNTVATKATGTGVYLSREDNHFYDLHEGGFGTGVLFGGGTYGEASNTSFFGGYIVDNGTSDISLTSAATFVDNSFYNVWFEGSSGPIVGSIPSGSYMDQLLNFWDCHLNTYSTASIFDLTNMVGGVFVHNSAWDLTNSSNVITSSTGQFWQWNSIGSPTFTGTNHYLNGVWTATASMGTTTVATGTCGDQTTVASPADMTNWGFSVNNNIYQNMVVQVYADSTPQIVVKLCNYTGSNITPTAGSVIVKAHP